MAAARTLMSDALPYGLEGKRIWVAGHRGMVGSALLRRLQSESCEVLSVGREEVDLRRQSDVESWLDRTAGVLSEYGGKSQLRLCQENIFKTRRN